MDETEFKKVRFAIRNLELLTTQQIESIKNMNEQQKIDIIIAYNEVMKTIIYYINNVDCN
jgi:hypothetical protein